MTAQTVKGIYKLLEELRSDKSQMSEFSNKRYSFCRTYGMHYLIYDSKTGTWFFSTGDTPAEALYRAIDERRAEWKYNEHKSKTHVEPIYTCSNCGVDAWGDRERTPYCYGCGAKMRNPWEEK